MEEKILFVDDDQMILSCLERILRRLNIETALGAVAALDAVARKGPYAVVVSDMRMPVMSGIELLARVKEMSPETVGVLLTGNADLVEAETITKSAVFTVIEKPCEPAALIRSLESALEQYRRR